MSDSPGGVSPLRMERGVVPFLTERENQSYGIVGASAPDRVLVSKQWRPLQIWHSSDSWSFRAVGGCGWLQILEPCRLWQVRAQGKNKS